MSKLPGFESAELPADAIEVGRIADAWGVKGWFKVLPHSADPTALLACNTWYVLPSEKGVKTFSGVAALVIAQVKIRADSLVATAQGLLDRTGAQSLRGARIYISRANFPTTKGDEYYWVDLIGLHVVNREGVDLGVVEELLSTGTQTVLVLHFEMNEKAQERLIPFVTAYVDDVDVAAKRIVVDWQADY